MSRKLEALREQFRLGRGVAWLEASVAPDGDSASPAVRFAIVWKEEDKADLGAPAYSLEEIERLLQASPVQIRAAHNLKVRLDATVLLPDDPHARPPRRNQKFVRSEPEAAQEGSDHGEPEMEP